MVCRYISSRNRNADNDNEELRAISLRALVACRGTSDGGGGSSAPRLHDGHPVSCSAFRRIAESHVVSRMPSSALSSIRGWSSTFGSARLIDRAHHRPQQTRMRLDSDDSEHASSLTAR
jgi:hypothetical protein